MKNLVLSVLILMLAALPALAGTVTVTSLCNRTYRLYIPTGVPANAPLVIALHPGLSNATDWETELELDAQADAQGFIAAYLRGNEANPFIGQKTWNAGYCCGYAYTVTARDVEFVRQAIRHIEQYHSVNHAKVYLAGYSNGAFLAYRYICSYPEDIAGMVVAAGALTLNYSECRPFVHVPIIHIYGLNDTNVPPAGGLGTGVSGVPFPPLSATMAQLQSRGATFTMYPLTGVDHDYNNIKAGLLAQYGTSQALLIGGLIGTTTAGTGQLYADSAHLIPMFSNAARTVSITQGN